MQFAATTNNSSDTHKQKGKKKKKKGQLFQQNARKDLETIAYTSLCMIWALVTFFFLSASILSRPCLSVSLYKEDVRCRKVPSSTTS